MPWVLFLSQLKLDTDLFHLRVGHEHTQPIPLYSSPEKRASLANGSARFEEWTLGEAILKRVTIEGRRAFQLEFEWDPCMANHQPRRASQPYRPGRRSQPTPTARRRARRGRFSEDDHEYLTKLNGKGHAWSKIYE